MGLLVDAHNNTRMIENRGHNPNELAREGLLGGIPTIVPGSSRAEALLKKAAPQLREMGMTVDLDGNDDTAATAMYTRGPGGNVIRIGKKIYPNDPCPCGSGKKYKKCCGRN